MDKDDNQPTDELKANQRRTRDKPEANQGRTRDKLEANQRRTRDELERKQRRTLLKDNKLYLPPTLAHNNYIR